MQHVLHYRQPLHNIIMLKDHPDFTPQQPQLFAGRTGNFLAVDVYMTSAGDYQLIDRSQQGGLARSGRTDNSDKFSGADLQTDIMQSADLIAINFLDMLHF